MFEDKIFKIYESTEIGGYLNLRRTELDDQTFTKLLGLKPSEVNIILSRVCSVVRNDGKEKTRGELLNDCLETLERSSVARNFVSIGLNENYTLFKGFPIRVDDEYYPVPQQNQTIVLKPQKVVIGWQTNATEARKTATIYDKTKGEAVGGALVETTTDSHHILFDVNAVIRVCRWKKDLIAAYNLQCSPGKSISKANVDFLANQSPFYTGELEVLTNNKVVNVRVLDTWSWTDNGDGNKVVSWLGIEKPKAEPDQPTEAPSKEPEHLTEMFNNAQIKEEAPVVLSIHDQIDESFMEKMKDIGNWINKTAAITVRGKTMKFLSYLLKQYEYQKQIYELASEFASKIDGDSQRQQYAASQTSKIDELIADVRSALQNIEENPKDGLSFASPEETSLKEDLHTIFNESTLGIFDRVADTVVATKDRVTHKMLDTIFKKLMRAMENHYHYRMKALEMQRELLTNDYKSYKGTRFENLPGVQKLKSMIEYTNENIRLVQGMKSQFEKDKMEASNFAFTGKSAPEENKEDVVALDKEEDKVDNAEAAMVNKVDDVIKKTEEPVSKTPTENLPPTPEEEKDVNDVVNSLEKGFSATAKTPPVIPKNFPKESKENIEKQLKVRGAVLFKKANTAKAFIKANPDWSFDEPMSNVFRVTPPNEIPVEKSKIKPIKPAVKKEEPVVQKEPEVKNAEPIQTNQERPTYQTPTGPKIGSVSVKAINNGEYKISGFKLKDPKTGMYSNYPFPKEYEDNNHFPSAEDADIKGHEILKKLETNGFKKEEPKIIKPSTPVINNIPKEEPPVAQPTAATPEPVQKAPEVVPIKQTTTPEAKPPKGKQIVPKDFIRPTDNVTNPADIDKMPAKRKDNFINYMNTIDLVNSSKEDIERIKSKLKAFPNSQQFKDNLKDAETKLATNINRLNIFKNDLDLRAHISDENTPAAHAAYKTWTAEKANKTSVKKIAEQNEQSD